MTNKHAQELGKLGGQATLRKYGKKIMTEWGKKGGRPRKGKIINESNKS